MTIVAIINSLSSSTLQFSRYVNCSVVFLFVWSKVSKYERHEWAAWCLERIVSLAPRESNGHASGRANTNHALHSYGNHLTSFLNLPCHFGSKLNFSFQNTTKTTNLNWNMMHVASARFFTNTQPMRFVPVRTMQMSFFFGFGEQ